MSKQSSKLRRAKHRTRKQAAQRSSDLNVQELVDALHDSVSLEAVRDLKRALMRVVLELDDELYVAAQGKYVQQHTEKLATLHTTLDEFEQALDEFKQYETSHLQ